MQRRTFIEAIGGLTVIFPATAAADGSRTLYYTMTQYFLRNGSQTTRIQDFLAQGLVPTIRKLHSGPVICLEALVAAHMPQVVVITGYRSLNEIKEVGDRMWKEESYRQAVQSWEAGAEAPYEHLAQALLAATDYSPEVKPADPVPATPRIFELRTYHSPTWRQLKALHERFAGPEIAIFHRVGVHPILYTSTVFGQNMPNLTYLIPFDSLAAREKAWAAFSADPEWVKVRKESIDRHGQISSVIQMALYRAAAYSPIK